MSPASIIRHSVASMTRGMTSIGQVRSMPSPSEYTVNVMPMVRMSRSAWSWRARTSDSPSDRSVSTSAVAAGRGSPSSSKSSFQVPVCRRRSAIVTPSLPTEALCRLDVASVTAS